MSAPLTAPADRAAIEAAIPHRDPFLFLDTVEELDEAQIRVTWRVPADGFWFKGHYPGQPVTPGVLLCEHALQAGAVFVSARLAGFSEADGLPVVVRVEDARFRQVVAPGDLLETQVKLTERVGPAWFLKGRITRGGKRIADVGFVLSAAGAMARETGS